jgi:hypothetical protein
VEVYPDGGVAVVRLRFDVFYIVDVGCQTALERRENALLHLVRRKAVVGVQDTDNGDVDVREDVHGIVRIAAPPRIAIRNAITTNV